jgi:hypothetical protein
VIAEKTDYQLTDAEAAVLKAATEDALGAAGARGGSIGGAIGGAVGGGIGGGAAGGAGGAAGGSKGGASGGRAGGRFGVRLTKAQTAETTVEVPADPEAVRERATAAIAESGTAIDDPNAAGDGSVWGIVPSGVKDMAPALVRVQVEATDRGVSRLHIRASGREGLIKQRIGAKAADRIAAAVSDS